MITIFVKVMTSWYDF